MLQESNEPRIVAVENAQTEFLRSSTSVHYVDATAEGLIRACSPAVEKALRQPLGTLSGTSVWELMPDSDAALLRKHLENRNTGDRFRLNFWNAQRATFPLQCSVHRNRNGFVLMGEAPTTKSDNGVQSRLAAELRRSNDDLEQFAYIASHDLQEPLRTVSGFAQLLQRKYKGRLDEQADEYIEFCISGAKRLQDLISGLLTYSRATRMGDTRERLDLNEIVRETVLLLGRAIQESNATISHGLLPSVWGNRQQIFQVVENLVGNALKFHGERRPEIHIEAEAGEGQWTISIQDNGVGIEPQYLERIFEPFQRLHGREYPGSGIGLALCRKVIERHGGRIWADPQPGAGTVFRFTLEDAACRKSA
jgi:signal transduction histidine kinase